MILPRCSQGTLPQPARGQLDQRDVVGALGQRQRAGAPAPGPRPAMMAVSAITPLVTRLSCLSGSVVAGKTRNLGMRGKPHVAPGSSELDQFLDDPDT